MTTLRFPSIDRVRTETDERLDRPDFDGILALADEAVQRQTGALMGSGGGVTAPPKITLDLTSATKTMALGPFQYYISVPAWADASPPADKGWLGAFATFNPASGDTATLVDGFNTIWNFAYTNGNSADAKSFLYIRPRAVPTDLDARQKYVGTADSPVSIKTRSRVSHEFKWSSLSPSAGTNSGWAPVLHIVAWSTAGVATNPGLPYINYYSCYDDPRHALFFPDADGSVYPLMRVLAGITPLSGPEFEGALVKPPGVNNTDFGVLQQLAMVRSRLSHLLDRTGATPWFSNLLDTFGGATDLATLASSGSRQVILSGSVVWDGAAYTSSLDLPGGWLVNVTTFAGVGGNPCVQLQAVPPAGTAVYAIQGITANPWYQASPVDNLFIRLCMVDLINNAPTNYNGHVYQFSTSNAGINGSFSFTMVLERVS